MKKIRLAAIYWILEVCGKEPVAEQERDNILKCLKSKNLLSYFDAINKEVIVIKEMQSKKRLNIPSSLFSHVSLH